MKVLQSFEMKDGRLIMESFESNTRDEMTKSIEAEPFGESVVMVHSKRANHLLAY